MSELTLCVVVCLFLLAPVYTGFDFVAFFLFLLHKWSYLLCFLTQTFWCCFSWCKMLWAYHKHEPICCSHKNWGSEEEGGAEETHYSYRHLSFITPNNWVKLEWVKHFKWFLPSCAVGWPLTPVCLTHIDPKGFVDYSFTGVPHQMATNMPLFHTSRLIY